MITDKGAKIYFDYAHTTIDGAKYFGNIIDNKSVLWAIENKYITDYELAVPKINLQDLEEMIRINLYNMKQVIKDVPKELKCFH